MDNNKKQNYSRTGYAKSSNQSIDSSNRQKSSSLDIQGTKYYPKNTGRRENPNTSARNNNSNNSKQSSAKGRPNVDKRPRFRGNNGYSNNNSNNNRSATQDNLAAGTGLESEDLTSFDSSLIRRASLGRAERNNSVYGSSSKKPNLNHLLNFKYTPREGDYNDGSVGVSSGNGGVHSYNQRHGHVKKHKYNKEQYLQANFQFVIKASAKRKTDDSPDTLIDWSLIEQINIQTDEELQCPICLHPPVAAKVTRCGHVYCWPCILRYLSYSDKPSRKCPLCDGAINVSDLKSAFVVKQKTFNINSYITFELMRRKKDSLFIEKHDRTKNDYFKEKYPYICSPEEEKLFSKFILAKRSDVADILSREQRELLAGVDELDIGYEFIPKALEILKERLNLLGDIEQKTDDKLEENCLQHSNIDNNDCIDNIDVASVDHLNNIKQTETAENNLCSQSGSLRKNTKFYYFYQSDDGQNIYLHPLNVKMLQACYGSLSDAPTNIKARIIQKEQYFMDEEHRCKFTCLGHLPLTSQFTVVEIELEPPYVTEDIIQAFKADILLRKKERQRRAREERQREKHINAINDRQMGKVVASTANINISSSDEFPTCGFEETLAGSDLDNVPSTSKGRRTKTVSTSSAGSCSYSTIAMHCQKEPTAWSTFNPAQTTKSLTVDLTTNDSDETLVLSTKPTNLGDVLAQAFSQNNERKTDKAKEVPIGNGNKKSKKSKKMLPLYSTGMNFTGN